MIKTKKPREIYLADGKPSAMGPVTHMTKVPMDISSHRELATFQVANLQNHEVILRMPWLKEHNPTIDWNDKRITFNSERWTTWCLKSSPIACAVPQEKALEENLITGSSQIQDKNGPTASDQSVRIKQLSDEARVPKKGSARAAGHNLCANEGSDIPARGQASVGTGIAIGLPHNIYGRIAPRSSLAVKHRLVTNAGVMDSDYRGEVKVVLANLGDQPYRVEKGDRNAQLIIEKIDNRELQEVTQLDDTERGDQGFGSSNTTMDQEVKGRKVKPKMEIKEISARAFRQLYRRGERTGILRWDEINNEIQLEAINISTELAIKNKKNNEHQDIRDTVQQGYHHLLDIFEKGEKTRVPLHPAGIDLGIDLEEGKMVPIKKVYALSDDQLEELHRYIKQNEDRGWIRMLKSGRATPIMLVKKKDGKLRLCADYRALDEVTKKDRDPLPLISKALDIVGGAKYFTKLDIKDPYHNIRIREGEEWKTSFSTKLRTYKYLVMPFGLCNALAAFQRWINKVLMEHIDMCCIVYLDDVLIYSHTLQQHRKDVSNILEAIQKSRMKVKPSKCEFHQSETEYLGFIIGQEWVKTDPVKTQAIWDWTTPKKIKEI